jgi:hypothetical protein
MIAGTATRPVGRRAHAEVRRPAVRASGTGFARRSTRVTRGSMTGALPVLEPSPAAAGGLSPAAAGGLSPAAAGGLSPAAAGGLSPAAGGLSTAAAGGLSSLPGGGLSSAGGAAPELASGPSRCGADGRSSGCSAGPALASATRTRLPNAGAAACCRTHGLRCDYAALRVPLPRLRRHLRGQPPDAGCRRPDHLSTGARRHRQAAVHSRRHGSWCGVRAAHRRCRWRLLRGCLRLLTRGWRR